MRPLSRRLPVLLAAVAVAAGVVAVRPALAETPSPSSFEEHTYPAEDGRGARDYWVYRPGGLDAAPAGSVPLVVYLHGCNQNGPDAALGTRWNELAEARGFVVAYPEQSDFEDGILSDGNGTLCWNWFRPEHQRRGAGEPATLAAIPAAVATAEPAVDTDRVYVIGVSAGADMATILAAAYPDVYAAAGIVAGCPYLTCTDATGAAAHEAMGERARAVPVFAVQGTADVLNNVAMGAAAVAQWLGTDDLADDGERNGSVPATPTAVEHHGFGPALLDGLGQPGDLCVRARQFPCVSGALGWDAYPYSVERHAGADGCAVVEAWWVHGLGHGYPGGNPEGTFTDPAGPDITTAAYDFFTRHSLSGGPCGA